MGTRHLIAAIVDGGYKVAQYGQWDGNPGGQGLKVLDFLRGGITDGFMKNLRGCRFGTDEEIKKTWTDAGADPNAEFVNMDVSECHKAANPHLSRDAGGDIFEMVKARGPLMLRDSSTFAADSLFCEWAYVVDFDKGDFEVYEGFNTEPVPTGERFAGLPLEAEQPTHRDVRYYPVKLVRKFKLTDLPSGEEFVRQCTPKDED